MLKELISYLEKDLNVQPNVAVTIILSLFTFSLGYIITWTAAGVSRFIKRKKYRKSLKVVIQNFLDSCEKQYLLLESHQNEKGFLQGENIVFSIKSNFGQTYLSTLDIKTFIENFSSITKRKRAQEITDLFEIVETAKASKETFKEQVKTYYLSYEKAHDKYNENLDGLRKLRDDLALNYYGKSVDKQSADYITSIADTFTRWTENGANTNIQATYNGIVSPLFESAKAIPPNPISRKVVDYCVQCNVSVKSIANCEQYIRDEIETLKLIHKDSYERGIEIIKKW